MKISTWFSLICFPSLIFSASLFAQDNPLPSEASDKQSSDANAHKIHEKYAKKKRDEGIISANDSMDLTEKQEQSLMNQANNGDGDAANKLGMYFDIVRGDSSASVHWLRKGAENGSGKAQYNLGCILVRRKYDRLIREEAAHWLELAEKNGMPEAKSVLEDLKKWDKRGEGN